MTTLGGYISLPPLLVDVCFQDIDIYVYIIKSKPSNLNIEFVQLPNIDHISMFRDDEEDYDSPASEYPF
ncbi:hypothetical protein [Bacillus atrophaeus]|nr:hypothetical protein [Bacillus atrophaeus]MCY8958498.1 hypothetical protein [Bacillus atrophaeus]MCY8964073.1 hypothetical protein [Bacillus atrophaeus]MCY9437187.1 hypothetical protein [Bacillus atrophaeus]MEC0650449.1 hypothetical protein [Bacillus atrophaeus]